MPASVPTAAADLAERQRGLVTRSQLVDLGITQRSIDRLVGGGSAHLVHPGVYRLAGVPVDWRQAQLAACLAGGEGTAASHRSAAYLWGMADGPPAVEVTVPRNRAPRLRGVVVHRSTDLSADDVTIAAGIPTTTPLRVIVDLGAVVPPWTLEDALDRALVRRLFAVADAEWMVTRVGRRGRRGVGPIRRVLDERALGAARPDGLLEPRMARLLRDGGLPPATFQHEVRDTAGVFVARVDFAYPSRLIAIEVDGFAVHGTPRALQHDLARQNRLIALGWRVVRFTWHDVVRRPVDVARTLRTVLGTSGAA